MLDKQTLIKDTERLISIWRKYLQQWKDSEFAQENSPNFDLKAETIIKQQTSFLIKLYALREEKKSL